MPQTNSCKMLSANIENIIYYLQSKRVNPADPSKNLLESLIEAEAFGKANFMIFDFENNSLFFASSGASSFFGFDKNNLHKYENVFLEEILHPASYQLMHFDLRVFQQKPEDCFSNLYFVKSEGKGKYSWIFASAKVVSFTSYGRPKLIYICFIEVEKALHYYLKILNNSHREDNNESPMLLVNNLKNREIEILGLICAEYTSKEIALRLNITQAAVDAARKRLIQKLGVKSVAGLVKIALTLGLNKPDGYGHGLSRNLIQKEMRSYPIKIKKRFNKKISNS